MARTKTAPVIVDVEPAIVDGATKPAKVKAATSCGQLFSRDVVTFASDEASGRNGDPAKCKRLPRHHGDHRPTLKQTPASKGRKVAGVTSRKSTRLSKAGLNRLDTKLAAAVEAGTLAPSIALSRHSAYQTRLANRNAKLAAAKRMVAA